MKTLFLRYWLPVSAHMGLIYYLSSRTSFPVSAPDWMFFADKLVHAAIFGLLGWLFLRAWLQGRWERFTLASGALTVLFVTLYGITDEVHQIYVPGREPSVADLIADVCGAVIIVCIVMVKCTPMSRRKIGIFK